MIRALLITLGCLSAAPATADSFCDELWFSRNMVFHQAGYCFGSTLGQSVFGNSGCIGQNVSISDAGRAVVDQVLEMEDEFNCSVNTSRTSIDFNEAPQRRILENQPVPSGFESACIGWLLAPVNLLAGHRATAAPVGQVLTGDQINFYHNPVGDWEYVRVYRNGIEAAQGWILWGSPASDVCANWAG